jgi:5-methylcytosine-specific restriction endonuclease McrA
MVEKPHNMGTWSKARYMSQIRSFLRQAFRYYKPITEARNKAKVGRGRYLCSACRVIFHAKEIQVDHIVPCGKLNSLDDVAGFIERLSCEDPNGYRVLCKPCHQIITNEERGK